MQAVGALFVGAVDDANDVRQQCVDDLDNCRLNAPATEIHGFSAEEQEQSKGL